MKVTAHIRRSLYNLWYFTQKRNEPYKTLWFLNTLKENPVDKVVQIGQWRVQYIDFGDLKFMWQLQFAKQYNDFYTTNSAPMVLDCGSNIGVSVIRYKQLYPQAKIIAFEPDPTIFNVLQNNIRLNNLPGVEAVRAAIWTTSGTQTFMAFDNQNSQAGHISLDQASNEPSTSSNSIEVKTVWLGDYLQSHVDFLKLDIEGAELEVLESCASLLSNVAQLMVEVHYRVNRASFLIRILEILHNSGFKIAIYQYSQSPNSAEPFQPQTNTSGDQFPVLWAWR